MSRSKPTEMGMPIPTTDPCCGLIHAENTFSGFAVVNLTCVETGTPRESTAVAEIEYVLA